MFRIVCGGSTILLSVYKCVWGGAVVTALGLDLVRLPAVLCGAVACARIRVTVSGSSVFLLYFCTRRPQGGVLLFVCFEAPMRDLLRLFEAPMRDLLRLLLWSDLPLRGKTVKRWDQESIALRVGFLAAADCRSWAFLPTLVRVKDGNNAESHTADLVSAVR